MTTVINRQEAPELRGYPKNGNVDNQAMTYRWNVMHCGRLVGSYARLKDAKALASEFGEIKPEVVR
jgi:hypothetical protein